MDKREEPPGESEPGKGEPGGGNPRLDDLAERLRAARARVAEPARKPSDYSGANAGIRIAVDMIAGVAVGAFLGALFDRWLGTQPWFLLGFFVLGAAAGMRNVLRSASQIGRDGKPGAAPPSD